MSKNKNKKKALFEKFSNNLKMLFENFEQDEIHLPEGGGYICPLGMTMHTKEGLNDEFQDQLTEEHSPPESMGGQVICLVRKDLNSTAGHTIDKELLNYLKFNNITTGHSEYPCAIKFGLPELNHINAEFSVEKKENVTLNIKTGAHNLKKIEKNVIDNEIFDGLSFELHFKAPNKNNKGLQSQFLRIAYLLAFSKLGYALIFGPKDLINQHYAQVRRQILNPELEIIPFVPIFKNQLPVIEGVGIITKPEEMKSIFVTFPLKVGEKTDYYSVLLPAPDETGFIAYNYVKNDLTIKQNLSIQYFDTFDFDFSRTPEDAIYFHLIWEHLNQID